MDILSTYLPKTEFDSYEDFRANFRLNVPEDFDYARDVVDRWAAIAPEKPALLYCNDEGDEKHLTFMDVSRESKRMASYFISLGISSGDRVLTLLRRRWEYWVCAIALHRLGAVVVPASIQLTAKDILYRVDEANARMVIAVDDPFVLEQLNGLREASPALQTVVITGGGSRIEGHHDLLAEYPAFPEHKGYSGLPNSAPLLIFFTSGTSGFPKMAVQNRAYPLSHIITAKYMQCVQDNGLHLTQADSGWAKFSWGNLYGQWLCGSAILAYDPIRFDARRLMDVMQKYRPTSVCIPPTMYRMLLRKGLKHAHTASVKWFSTAGEPLSGEVNQTFERITGLPIHEGYGQSETSPITCTFQWLPVRPSSMGKPSPLYDVVLMNKNGRICAPHENGEVVIRIRPNQIGLLTAYGYSGQLKNPVTDGLYHTGDIAYADEDGYFWYVGRIDDMIKSSGYRIGPFEIESVLNTHQAVKECAIVGRADEIRGQIVCAIVVLSRGYVPSEALTQELQDYVKHNTAPYKYPRIVEYVSALPKTTSGKIMHSALATK